MPKKTITPSELDAEGDKSATIFATCLKVAKVASPIACAVLASFKLLFGFGYGWVVCLYPFAVSVLVIFFYFIYALVRLLIISRNVEKS